MIEDRLQAAIETVCAGSALGLVARWALIGVVAAVILVRVRGGGFGWAIGSALFALGATALVVLGACVRAEGPRHSSGRVSHCLRPPVSPLNPEPGDVATADGCGTVTRLSRYPGRIAAR